MFKYLRPCITPLILPFIILGLFLVGFDISEIPYPYFITLLLCISPPLWNEIIGPLFEGWEVKYKKEVSI